MKNNRDDFSKKTISIAASRAGYRCSFPGCGCLTIGASMEGKDKVASIGVAAHICAAAKGGPRYDEKMTSDERKSIDNCIWMCQTHSRVIDQDTATYTAELLRQWKKEAEEKSAKQLADFSFYRDYYMTNENNLDILKQIFDEMIIDGEFEKLNLMLNQYTNSLTEYYDEFILRYKIIYETYCDRNNLEKSIEDYRKLSCHCGVEQLAGVFLSFGMAEQLKDIQDFLEVNQLKQFVSLEIEGQFRDFLFVPKNTSSKIMINKELEEIILKYESNDVFINKIYGLTDVEGNSVSFYTEELYYEVLYSIYKLTYYNEVLNMKFENIKEKYEYNFFIQNFSFIETLDKTLKLKMIERFLIVLLKDKETFESYYSNVDDSLKDSNCFKQIKYYYDIQYRIEEIDSDILLKFTLDINDFSLLLIYLSCLHNDVSLNFLEEHSFLFKLNSQILELYLNLSNEETEIKYKILHKYSDHYKNDFLFHCLLWTYGRDSGQELKELDWLDKNEEMLDSKSIVYYIDILQKYNKYEKIIFLSKSISSNKYLFEIANYLANSNNSDVIKQSLLIYNRILQNGFLIKNLYQNIGISEFELGYYIESEENFKKEYDLFETLDSLKLLFRTRIQCFKYIQDEYFEKAKSILDSVVQNYVGVIYLKNNSNNQARKHFLRSLLLDDTNFYSFTGLYNSISSNALVDIDCVKENTVCILKNEFGIRNIAIHSRNIIDGIENLTSFAGCEHHSIDDSEISSLLFCKKGDNLTFEGDFYELQDVIFIDDYFCRQYFSALYTHDDVTIIKADNISDFNNQILPFLKEQKMKVDNVIKSKDESVIPFPVTILSRKLGKSLLNTIEYLFLFDKNKYEIIFSNPIEDFDNDIFILSYDTIVLLATLEVPFKDDDFIKLFCSEQVVNQILEDINTDFNENNNLNQGDGLIYRDSQINYLEKPTEMRRARHLFLTNVKRILEHLNKFEVSSTFVSKNEQLKKSSEELFIQNNLFYEGCMLASTENFDDCVVVTDDEFLRTMAYFEPIKCIGIVELIIHMNLHWFELLEISKKLKELNFKNYIDFNLYKSMVEKLLIESTDIDDYKKIEEWIVSNKEDEAIINLSNIIVSKRIDNLNLNHIFYDLEKDKYL